MKLIIRNLGAIKQLEVDFSKKLTLLCGPNNTGKTYVSYVLQAFLDFTSYMQASKSVHKHNQIRETGSLTFTHEDLQQWLTFACQRVSRDLGAVFGISDDTKDKLFSKFELEGVFTEEDYQRAVNDEFTLQMTDSSWGLKATKPSGIAAVKVEPDGEGSESMKDDYFRMTSFGGLLVRTLILGNAGGVRMLTVERNSIYTFKTELSISRNELIDRIQQNADRSEINILDILNTSSRRYPAAVRSSLRIANDLENVQKSKGPYADIADQIEKDLLYGEVSMTKNGDVEFHSVSMTSKKRLPFHLSSSIVKTMASLVIYLRHLARKYDTLIIDEPEMNFHPDVQVLLARIFAVLVQRDLRLIISTHSDYIVREFNSLIMVDSLRRKPSATVPEEYNPEMRLAPAEMQVLLFEYTPKRRSVTVNSLEIQPTGFSIKTIDETIMSQNEMAQSLYDALEEEDTDE